MDDIELNGGLTWSDFSGPVFTFARVLRAAALMPDDEDEYWGGPHKWEPEHQLWIAAGQPEPPAPATPLLAWERFVRSVQACDELADCGSST